MILNAIKQMERAARSDPAVISLSQGIPFRPSDDGIRQAAIQAIVSGKADAYSDPQGLRELRQKIAQLLKAQNMDYQADEVLITAGAIEGLAVALMSVMVDRKGEVVVPTPVYAAYFRTIELAGGTAVPIVLNEKEAWSLSVSKVERAVTKHTKAILLCHPNNPTGSVYSKSVLRELADLAVRKGIVLIIDEVYGNMLYQDEALYTPAVEAKYKRNIIRIVSFSKDYSLTGWRVGFLHTSLLRIPRLLALHDTLVNCAPVVSQYAALAALDVSASVLAENRRVYDKNRTRMATALHKLSPYCSYVMPRGAYFFFVKIHGLTDSVSFCERLLIEQKLAVVPGNDFGLGGQGYVRLCFGRSEAAVDEGMRRFTAFLTGSAL